jgi:SAM-dependent methyltransferase
MVLNIRSLIKRVIPPPLAACYRGLRQRTMGRCTAAAERPADVRGDSATPPWRDAVGGMWDEIGRLQLDFLVAQGLQPHHRLLDIGCGSLRAGVHFVRYLDDGRYYGIDAQQWLLDAGAGVELPRAGLARRQVHLLCRDDFEFAAFGTSFEFAIAQSVFTHLPWNSILRCLCNIRRVLCPAGRFFATFFEDADGSHQATPLVHAPAGVVTYPDKDPYHYPFDVFGELARRAGLGVRYRGPWSHPRGQNMMVFSLPPR